MLYPTQQRVKHKHGSDGVWHMSTSTLDLWHAQSQILTWKYIPLHQQFCAWDTTCILTLLFFLTLWACCSGKYLLLCYSAGKYVAGKPVTLLENTCCSSMGQGRPIDEANWSGCIRREVPISVHLLVLVYALPFTGLKKGDKEVPPHTHTHISTAQDKFCHRDDILVSHTRWCLLYWCHWKVGGAFWINTMICNPI